MEVAQFTGLQAGRLRSWFRGRSDGKGLGRVFLGDYRQIDGDYAVSFLDMIDVLVAGELRDQGISMRLVRRAHAILSNDLGTRHPFCHRNLYAFGKRIIVALGEGIEDTELRDAVSRQQLFTQIRPFLKRIDYGQATQLATRWRISDGVIIDPQINFGKPVVAAVGISTYVLASQYCANGEDFDLVAGLFDVAQKDVLNAVQFEEAHGSLRAA